MLVRRGGEIVKFQSQPSQLLSHAALALQGLRRGQGKGGLPGVVASAQTVKTAQPHLLGAAAL